MLRNYIEAMKIDCAWTITEGNPNITVAVVDLFFDDTHPDLQDKFVEIKGNCNPAHIICNHGMSMAGAIAAIVDNGNCVAGSGNKTTVAGYCAGHTCNSGSPGPATIQAYEDGYKIISLSWTSSPITRAQALEMVENGVVIIGSGRGNGWSQVQDIDGVIVVGQVNSDFEYVPYASFGDNYIDIYAACLNVPRLTPFGTCEVGSGNASFGAATVAGIVALMKDVNPCLTPGDIERIIKETHQGLPVNAHQYPEVQNGIIDAYEAVKAAQNFQGTDVVVTDVESWEDQMISGDLIIETGAELTITGTVRLASNSNIRVMRGARLILDGGTLKLNPMCYSEENPYWGAIFVEGNSVNPAYPENVGKVFIPQPVNEYATLDPEQAGVFISKNNAVINGTKGISTNTPYFQWPEKRNYYGGLIVCENTTFINCWRGVALMKYGTFLHPDNSRFINCTFENGVYGITNWASSGVRVEGTEFINIERASYLTYDAATEVINGNHFIGDKESHANRAIDIIGTHPIVNRTIIGGIGNPNKIDNFDYGIYLTAQESNLGIRVEGNTIENTYIGILNLDQSNFHFYRNQILDNDYAMILWNSGASQINEARDNYFKNTLTHGIYSVGKNGGLKILNNCFEKNINNTYSDILLTGIRFGGFGEIYSSQRVDQTTSAGNIFSERPNQNRYPFRYARNNNTGFVPFDYHLKTDCIGIPCYREPRRVVGINIENNISQYMTILRDKENDPENQCENESPPYYPEMIEEYLTLTIPQLKTLLSNHISSYGNLDSLDHLNYALNKRRVLMRALSYKVAISENPQQLNSIITTFPPNSIEEAMIYYAIFMETNPLAAQNYLLTLSFEHEDWYDFKLIQEINLNRIINNHQATSSELDYLYDRAQDAKIYSGYARGLYHFFVGEHIEIELPNNQLELLQSPGGTLIIDEIYVSPNPFKDEIQFNLPVNKGIIKIYDISGKMIYQQKFRKDNFVISNLNFANGIYIIEINDENQKVIHSQQIIKN